MAECLTGARYLAQSLHDYGVTDVFFMEAILRHTLLELEKLGIRRVLAHSEKGAAYMADGYARASGKVGICMAQSVGAANLAAGLQDAYLARSPVIAFTGHKAIPELQRNAYQEIAHPALYQSVTRFSASIEDTSQLPILLRQAFREATGPTPRPAHLDFVGHTGEVMELGPVDEPVAVDTRHGRLPAYRNRPDPDDVLRAARLIDTARQPVAVIGSGAVVAGAADEVRALADTGIPVAYALDGKGLVDDNRESTLGAVGNYSAPYANKVIHDADLILYIGSDTSDMATGNWRAPHPEAAIVQIDADPAEIGRNFPGVTGICGDPGLVLRDLVELLRSDRGRDWIERTHALRRQWLEEVEPRSVSEARPTTVERLCREIERALPEDALLVADTGYSGIWTGTHIKLNGCGQDYLRAAGSLGWGFPAAIGAQCALPGRPVVCFCGDGGFYYHLSELETARRWNLPVTVIVNNNASLGQDISGVREVYGAETGRAEDLTHFEPVDFAEVAKAFGCHGIRVEEPGSLADAITNGIASNQPTVIDVVTDPEPRAPDAWFPPPSQ